jgi:hypothetical protein
LKLRPLGRRSATLSLAQQSAPHKCATDQWPDGELRPLGTFDRFGQLTPQALFHNKSFGEDDIINAALRLRDSCFYRAKQ